MGYKTEINYILKSSSKMESKEINKNLSEGNLIRFIKSGHRTFVLDSPIMFADECWKILGMCLIQKVSIDKDETIVTAVVLTVFKTKESEILTRIIQEAEVLKLKYSK